MNEICKNCGGEKRHHHFIEGDIKCVFTTEGEFEPSGRVSVPVEFVEAVRKLEHIWYSKECGEWAITDCMKEQDKVFAGLRPMLAAIDGNEKSHE